MANAKIEDLLRAVLQNSQAGASALAQKLGTLVAGNADAGDATEAVLYSAFPISDA